MSETATIGQLYAALSTLANRARSHGWESIPKSAADAALSDPDRLAEDFIQFMRNGGRLLVEEMGIVPAFFNVNDFVGAGWKFSPEDHDARNDYLAVIDFGKVRFMSPIIVECKTNATWEQRLNRIKAGRRIRYGATTFKGLWDNYEANKKGGSVLEMLFITQNVTRFDFSGDVLVGPNDERCVIFVERLDSGIWIWALQHLNGDCDVDALTAVG